MKKLWWHHAMVKWQNYDYELIEKNTVSQSKKALYQKLNYIVVKILVHIAFVQKNQMVRQIWLMAHRKWIHHDCLNNILLKEIKSEVK